MSTASTAGAAYRRTRVTWVAFGALFAFGILNAALGPVLPYLRAAQGASYVAASLHPVAFAIGVVTAGIHANRSTAPRKPIIIAGLGIAALAGLLLGYGDLIAVTIAAAFLLGLFATVALIRTWAVLADAHNQHRATAMAEGEVYVSLAGIATPILISLCAATFLGWQSFFLIAAAMVTVAVTAVWLTRLPRSSHEIATTSRPRSSPNRFGSPRAVP